MIPLAARVGYGKIRAAEVWTERRHGSRTGGRTPDGIKGLRLAIRRARRFSRRASGNRSLAVTLLALSSAILHATWNLFAKRAGGGAAFVWLFNVLSAVIYAPLALGARLLAEGDSRRRVVAAGGMVLGVIALAVG